MSHKKERVLSDTYSIRLDELATPLVILAEEEGVDTSKIIRRACRIYLKESNNQDYKVLESLLGSFNYFLTGFGNVGSNLNQLTHAYHNCEKIEAERFEATHSELKASFKELNKLLLAVRKELKTELH